MTYPGVCSLVAVTTCSDVRDLKVLIAMSSFYQCILCYIGYRCQSLCLNLLFTCTLELLSLEHG